MKLAVVGSINMDMTVCVEQIPKKGETVLGNNLSYSPGGKGANQAVAMSRLGADVWMFGCVGDDSNGTALIHNFKQQDVHTEYIQVLEDVPTGFALITVGEKDNTIVVVSGANAKVDITYAKKICPLLHEFDMVVLQHEIPIKAVEYVVDFCATYGIPVLLNPAPAAEVAQKTIEQVTFLTPNEHETMHIFGQGKKLEDLLQLYPEKLIVTRGSQGVSVGLKNGKVLDVPANKVNVVDTTGAGDTFNGAFCVRIARGDSLSEALRFANVAAGLSTQRMGAQSGMPTEEEVFELLKKETDWRIKYV